MQDAEIVALYWERDERAIAATADKYGHYCMAIAGRIVQAFEVEECVNDTYLAAWSAMPPHRPSVLSAFLGKLTRNICFNRWQKTHAEKRGSGELPVILDELAECTADRSDVVMEVERKQLIEAVNAFLGGLPGAKRRLFVRRYWYADSIPELSKRFGISENHVSVSLNRIRHKLHTYLCERGWQE